MSKILNELINDEEMSVLNKIDNKELIELLKSKKILPSEFFKNSLSSETAKKLHKHIEQSRAEWDRF
ncbi:MAG: hypothetical protein RO257_14800 [Candidatus Kapabacteria bacterium]|nr:hypothetical protein [Candidatus Kapabacteria bacterium]